MNFKAIIYDTENGEPIHLDVHWINVKHNRIGGSNGLQYREFKLFHVDNKYRSGSKLIHQTLTDNEIQGR